MLMKNSNDTIGNRTRHLPACSAMPQPTALARDFNLKTYTQLPRPNPGVPFRYKVI